MKAEKVVPTLSPSMDIQVSSNFERLLFDMMGRDGVAVARTLNHFRKDGPFQIDDAIMEKLRATFASGHKDDTQTLEMIRIIHQKHNYMLDPHSAVGVACAEDYLRENPESCVVSLATAHPAKFIDAVKKATGLEPPVPPQLFGIGNMPEKFHILPSDVARVRDFIRENVSA